MHQIHSGSLRRVCITNRMLCRTERSSKFQQKPTTQKPLQNSGTNGFSALFLGRMKNSNFGAGIVEIEAPWMPYESSVCDDGGRMS